MSEPALINSDTPTQEGLYQELFRPRFHYTTAVNWVNDPNGLVYYKGEYHLFYQYNPYGREWGNMSWGHAISPNLVHWREMPVALEPDEKGSIFSGSAVVDWKNTAGFKKGEEQAIVAAFTYAGNYGRPQGPFTQALAFSNDRGRTWIKYENNPVLVTQSGGFDRDPRVFWHHATNQWIMALYLDQGRRFTFYTSPDLKNWEPTGFEISDFYECPEMFQVPIDDDVENTRWVLYGAEGDYLIGTFDGRAFQREDGKFRSDFGRNFYASQIYSDVPSDDGRRIQIAWMAGGEYPGMPFNQQLSFPCELSLKTFQEGVRLCRYPVREIELLYQDELILEDKVLPPGKDLLKNMVGSQIDLEFEIELGTATELTLNFDETVIRYYVGDEVILCLGATAPLKPVENRIKLRLLVDRTSIELFGNGGRISMSSCFLMQGLNAQLGLRASGGEAHVLRLRLSHLRSAWETGEDQIISPES